MAAIMLIAVAASMLGAFLALPVLSIWLFMTGKTGGGIAAGAGGIALIAYGLNLLRENRL